MKFSRMLNVIHALSTMETGGTVGNIEKMLPQFTRAQIERTLKALEGEGDVIVEKVPYKGSIVKNVYHLTKECVDTLEMVVKTYDDNCDQTRLMGM